MYCNENNNNDNSSTDTKVDLLPKDSKNLAMIYSMCNTNQCGRKVVISQVLVWYDASNVGGQ